MNYSKNGFCTAKKQTDCENFRSENPWPELESDLLNEYIWPELDEYISQFIIKKLKQEAENARSAWRFFRWWRISNEIRRLKKIQRLCADPVDTIADIQDCR